MGVAGLTAQASGADSESEMGAAMIVTAVIFFPLTFFLARTFGNHDLRSPPVSCCAPRRRSLMARASGAAS